MKYIFLFITTAMISPYSYTSTHYGQVCLTHGECQELIPIEEGLKCAVVSTGIDFDGKVTCALKCYSLPVGSFCKKINDSQLGLCKKEKYQAPTFNPSNPNCENAIEPL